MMYNFKFNKRSKLSYWKQEVKNGEMETYRKARTVRIKKWSIYVEQFNY